jgi:hypothetical protein
MKYIIYAYTNEDGKFYYIGRGRPGREKENHKKIKVSPKDKILILHKNLSLSESVEYEKSLIQFYGRKCDGGILENKSIGGHTGSSGVPSWNKGLKCDYVSENNKKERGNCIHYTENQEVKKPRKKFLKKILVKKCLRNKLKN